LSEDLHFITNIGKNIICFGLFSSLGTVFLAAHRQWLYWQKCSTAIWMSRKYYRITYGQSDYFL